VKSSGSRKRSRRRCEQDPHSPLRSDSGGVCPERELDRARETAEARRAEARQLEIAGNSAAGSTLRAAARVLDESARFWEAEIDRVQVKPGRGDAKHSRSTS
jgi:hypothetical protein